MQVFLDPAHMQTTGVGVAALLATVLVVFIFFSARRERLARVMLLMMFACSVWAWFGFLYELVPNLFLARELRVVSVMGIVGINVTELMFASVYLAERVQIKNAIMRAMEVLYGMGAVLFGLLISDLFGTRYIVGALRVPQAVALAPDAGPLMAALIAYFIFCTASAGVLLAWRSRAGTDETDRRQALLLFLSMTVGLALGGTRFTPWYGFNYYPLVGDIGFPLFAFAALYSIQRYRLLNVQVAAAQILVFALWAFTFFRMLLEPSISAAIPDMVLFAIVVVLGIFLLRSVVAEKRAQQALADIEVEQVKSEFATIAAHQLRTPLSALRWAFNLLLTDTARPLVGNQREIAIKGARAADNMMALADDLLNVARITEGKLTFNVEPGDVRDTCHTAIDLLKDEAGQKRIQLRLHVPDALPQVMYDRGKLALAIENLIDNAIKYTPPGGQVDLTVSAQGGRVMIAVQDTGIGISEKDQSRLFERFYRAAKAVHEHPNGTGLGLFIAKTIVEGHGGHIGVQSTEGQGATFTITLAAKDAPKKDVVV